jgi:hypothetical protein
MPNSPPAPASYLFKSASAGEARSTTAPSVATVAAPNLSRFAHARTDRPRVAICTTCVVRVPFVNALDIANSFTDSVQNKAFEARNLIVRYSSSVTLGVIDSNQSQLRVYSCPVRFLCVRPGVQCDAQCSELGNSIVLGPCMCSRGSDQGVIAISSVRSIPGEPSIAIENILIRGSKSLC